METISDSDFKFLQELSEDWMGSIFSDDKKYLFEARLVGMAKHFDFPTIKDLIQDMRLRKANISPNLKEYFVDIITTHETLFFRDKNPYKNLRDSIIPEIISKKGPSGGLNIYSAACSTGQEPLSIVIALNECLDREWFDALEILATDISAPATQYAKNGVYSQYEVQRGIPTKLLNKYFEQENISWRIKKEFSNKIKYQTENLIKPDFKLKKFDIVFCRNATIYMDKKKVRTIYEHFHKHMAKESFLIVGNSERMSDHTDLFEYIKTESGIVYKRISK